MGIKSSWPGPENSTPINSRAISELKFNDTVTKYSSENDFRVKISQMNAIFDEIERNNHKVNENELIRNIKCLKEHFNTCDKKDFFSFSKIVNELIKRLNVITANPNSLKQVLGLIYYFRKELINHNHDSIKEKASKISA